MHGDFAKKIVDLKLIRVIDSDSKSIREKDSGFKVNSRKRQCFIVDWCKRKMIHNVLAKEIVNFQSFHEKDNQFIVISQKR